MWLDAPKSKYHGIQEEKGLPESHKAKNAEMIICWTISGVIGCIEVGAFWFAEPLAVEGPAAVAKAVLVFLDGLTGHSLMIWPSFLQ